MGAGSPESIAKIAARGHNLLLDQFASVEQIGERIALFKAAVEAHGRIFDPMSVGVTRSINVVMTRAEREKAIEARMRGRQRIDRLAPRPDAHNRASLMCYADTYQAPEATALH